MTVLDIYFVFLKLGFISFGGVFGVLPELERMVVVEKSWLTHDQFIQSYVIGQFVPGPNMAMCPLIGYWIAGWPGWLAGLLGIYTGPVLVMGAAYGIFKRYRDLTWVRRIEISFRPLIAGLLLGAAIHLWWLQTTETRILGVGVSLIIFEMYRRKILGPTTLTFLAGFMWVAGTSTVQYLGSP